MPPKTTLNELLKRNKSVDFATFDFFDEDHVAALKLEQKSSTSKAAQLELLKTHQRLLRLTGDVKSAKKLQRKKLHSALQIAHMSEQQFVATHSSAFRSNGTTAEAQATQVHRKALALKSGVMRRYHAYRQHHDPHYNAMRGANLKIATNSALKHIPSYAELFGTINFCTCPECRSIFSPAAYFVDLMRLQDQFIVPDETSEETPIPLDKRRGDLWEIYLSCANTNNEIPKIDIVNEVLQAQLQQWGGVTSKTDFDATTYPLHLPVNLPLERINTYMEQEALSLWQLWDELQPASSNNGYYLHKAGISASQWQLVSQPIVTEKKKKRQNNADAIEALYGLPEATEVTGVEPIGLNDLTAVPFFLQQTGISANALDELIGWELPAAVTGTYYINQDDPEHPIVYGKAPANNDDPFVKETLEHFTALPRLQRVNLFIRLAGYLQWSLADLNTLLHYTGNTIDKTLLPYLSWMQALLHANPQLSVNQLCNALFPFEHNAFFESIFYADHVPPLPGGCDWLNDTTEWVVPGTDGTGADTAVQASLEAALQVSTTELIRIGQTIADTNGCISLNGTTLSQLYRLTQLPALTGLSTAEALVAVTLPEHEANSFEHLVGDAPEKALQQLQWLQHFAHTIQPLPFHTFELQYYTTGSSDDPGVQNQVFGTTTLQNFAEALSNTLESMLFTPAVLTTALTPVIDPNALFAIRTAFVYEQLHFNTNGELEKAPTVNEMAKVLITVDEATSKRKNSGDGTAIFPVDNPNNPSVQAAATLLVQQLKTHEGKPLSEAQLTQLLQSSQLYYYALGALGELHNGVLNTIIDANAYEALYTCQAFRVTNTALQKTLTPLLTTLTTNHYEGQQAAWINALGGLLGTNAEVAAIVAGWVKLSVDDVYVVDNAPLSATSIARIRQAQRYAGIIDACSLAQSDVTFIQAHASLLGMMNNAEVPISWQNVVGLYQFKLLQQRFEDGQNGFLQWLKKPDATTLSQLTQWPEEQVQWLMDHLASMENKMAMVLLMEKWFTHASTLHTSVQLLNTLLELVADTDAPASAYTDAANMLWASYTSLYEEAPGVLQALAGKTAEQYRDAMVPYLIWQLNLPELKVPAFTSPRSLYQYLLIDVEVSSAVTTSRVLEAVSAVQLYLYRSRNNLEPGIKVHDDLNTWWDWLSSYRTWEANREIFLYPENYILPELRTNTSPEFVALTNALQQGDLSNSGTVAQAFNTYMDGFTILANLQLDSIAAYSYSTGFEATRQHYKTLCSIGRTAESPASWYYRASTFMVHHEATQAFSPVNWGAWKPIDVKMDPAGEVNAVHAFGTWYVFWVETYQIEDPKPSETGEETPSITVARILYSYLDFNQQWVAPVILAEDLTPYYRKDSTAGNYNTVYPHFIASTRTIVVFYGRGDTSATSENSHCFTIAQNERLANFSDAMAHITPKTIKQSPEILGNSRRLANGKYWYNTDFNSYTLTTTFESCAFWFRQNGTAIVPEKGMPLIASNNSSGGLRLNDQQQLANGNVVIPGLFPLEAEQWHHIVINEETFTALDVYNVPEIILFDDELIAVWANEEYDLWTAKLDRETYSIIEQYPLKYKGEHLGVSPNSKIILQPHSGDALWPFGTTETRLYLIWEGNEILVGDLSAFWKKKKELKPFETDIDRTDFSFDTISSGGNVYFITHHNFQPSQTKRLVSVVLINIRFSILPDGFNPKEISTIKIDDKAPILASQKEEDIFVHYTSEDNHPKLAQLRNKKGTFELVATTEKANAGTRMTCLPTDNTLLLMGIYNSTIQLSYYAYDGNDISSLGEVQTTWPANNLRYDYNLFTQGNMVQFVFDNTKESIPEIPNGYVIPSNRLYVNGTPVGGALVDVKPAKSVYLGKDGSNVFDGCMTEVLFYGSGLTTSEAQNLYSNSSNRLPLNFGVYPETNNNPPGYDAAQITHKSVLGQPNWFTVNGSGQYYLNTPFINTDAEEGETGQEAILLHACRLNSDAAKALRSTLHTGGIDGLLSIPSQELSEPSFMLLEPQLELFSTSDLPTGDMDFTNSAMSDYFWEIFFHAPFLVAQSLQTQQRFEQAKRWFEFVFNPTINQQHADLHERETPNDQYWRFVGLRSYNNLDLQEELGLTPAESIEANLNNNAQIYQYHFHPFNPHAIARIRPIAYQKTMVMHYVQNLIEWGDQLFRQYNQESIREATMLYVMGYDLLGERPVNMGECPLPSMKTLKQLLDGEEKPSQLSEFLIHVEQAVGQLPALGVQDTPANYIADIYFGIPENEGFKIYWDIIEQRLYNIRHQLNIDGVAQSMTLFETIDPMQLVQAVASGQSALQAASSVTAHIPYYRFEVMLQKAKELTQQTISLGQSLLAALEKKDGEALAQLLNSNEQHLQAMSVETREYAIEEAAATMEGLATSIASATMRQTYFMQLLEKGRIPAELSQLDSMAQAIASQVIAVGIRTASWPSYLLPNTFGLANGGMNYGEAAMSGAIIMESLGNMAQTNAQVAAINAEFQRREEDWNLQEKMAAYEVTQLTAQLEGASFRHQMAQRELKLLETNIAQLQQVENYYKNKFTAAELYQWMSSKLSALYFQTHQLAVEAALQAQQAWCFEKATTQSFIQPGYWNNLYQGLLAGEGLMLDLNRMEAAYMQQNFRRLELSKTVSMALQFPEQLEELKTNGTCTFSLNAANFDWDFPGHYQRLIKSISISFPVLLGPYQNVHATLTQTSNQVLLQPDKEGVQFLYDGKGNSDNIRTDVRNHQQVALTQGMNDSGLFTLNFNDERLLPFEGTGAISKWQLDMPADTNPIDFNTLTDVIVTINYTALAGDANFAKAVRNIRKDYQGVSVSTLQQLNAAALVQLQEHQQVFDLNLQQFKVRKGLHNYQATAITLVVMPTEAGSFTSGSFELKQGKTNVGTFTFKAGEEIISSTVTIDAAMDAAYTLVPKGDWEAAKVRDVLAIVAYSATTK